MDGNDFETNLSSCMAMWFKWVDLTSFFTFGELTFDLMIIKLLTYLETSEKLNFLYLK